MKRIPTAKEFHQNYIQENNNDSNIDIEEMLIEFAKLHLEEQTDSIINNIFNDFDMRPSINNDTIRNAYPLKNVK
jgi:hypothetical protein